MRVPGQNAIAKSIATFGSALTVDDLSETAVSTIERSIVDTAGVVLAGWDEPETSIVRSARRQADNRLVAVPGTEPQTTLVNGVAGHCLDFDDCGNGIPIHPSVVMVPPLLSLADRGQAGDELIVAYAVGFETQHYLLELLGPTHYDVGWHATATVGTFGATAAVATFLDLDETAFAHALNIAASFPAGLKRNFGTTTKSIHAGHAARSGLVAAQCARHGATADTRAISGTGGFLDRYDGDPPANAPDGPTADGNLSVVDPGIQLKRFPCCNYTHTSIAVAIQLREQYAVDPEDIAQVTVEVSRDAAETVPYEEPSTPLEAKFSFQHTVATALAVGDVTLDSFEENVIGAQSGRELREKITVVPSSKIPSQSLASTVTIETTDGRTMAGTRERPAGSQENPFSDAELQTKFRRCATRATTEAGADELFEFFDGLAAQDSMEWLVGRQPELF